MSYTQKFAGVAGAAGAMLLAAQVANAQTYEEAPGAQIERMEQLDRDLAQQNHDTSSVPPQIRPFIGDLDVQFSGGITFEKGELKRTAARLNITNIECDFIEPIVEEDLARSDAFAFARSPAEEAAVNAIRTLFQDRVYDFNETISGNEIASTVPPEFQFFLPPDISEEASVHIHLECSDYETPPPSFTPVEPY